MMLRRGPGLLLRHGVYASPPALKRPRVLSETPRVAPVIARYFFGFGGGKDEKGDGGKEGDGKDDAPKNADAEPIVEDGVGDASNMMVEAVGMGDAAPRPNPLLILPVDRKPLFPGMVQGLILSHRPTIEAIHEMHHRGGNNYVGVFFRRPGTLGAAGSGDDYGSFPEVISDPSEIFQTGTLAQVHPATMGQDDGGMGGGSSPHMQVFLTLHRRLDFRHVVKAGPPMVSSPPPATPPPLLCPCWAWGWWLPLVEFHPHPFGAAPLPRCPAVGSGQIGDVVHWEKQVAATGEDASLVKALSNEVCHSGISNRA